MIDICTLGTGGSIPMPDRALSSLYVRQTGRSLLIDCGEGTQTQIRRLGWGFLCIEGLLITHYHGDHVGGLPGLLLSLDKAGRTAPFPIYGPPGLRRIVDGLLVIAPSLNFQLELHELPINGGHFSLCGFSIDAFRLEHGVPCLGYRLVLPRPRKFDPQKASQLSIPMKYWHFLQDGQPVTLNDTVFLPEQVLGAPRPGLSLLFATDTRPTHLISEMGQQVDLMILEGMYGEGTKYPQAIKNHHMLFAEAAQLASEARPKQLMLTHFSNSIDDPLDYLPIAQAIFPACACAEDLWHTTLRYPT